MAVWITCAWKMDLSFSSGKAGIKNEITCAIGQRKYFEREN